MWVFLSTTNANKTQARIESSKKKQVVDHWKEALVIIVVRTPEQFPSVVTLLAESYNPHVRCGAAMALGLACAGTGNREAIAVLEPMLNDAVNYVRQGVLIASALICIQHTEATCPKMPNVDYISNAPPSVFAYPPALVDKKEEKKEKVETAVLSITAKQKKRDLEKKGEKTDEAVAMETDSDEKKVTTATTTDEDNKSKKDVDDKDKVTSVEKKDDSTALSNKKEKEPDSEILHNPTRVVKAQQRVLSLPKGSRYQPIKDITHAGILLVKDTHMNEPETLVELAKAGGPTKEEDLPEPPPPEPFEYRDE
ncbi:unnamed protein product [Rotaria magnacalcarata]|uniref:26S proteasome regulatory subunit RPN2 C-terminal domain-containing protein n=1 Tax=Rotaria magnacalcarata TaxID=392030 RepID=A0A8S2JZE2_9BILA|nr:unnamed protein product [Rotaria magnacalcarata]CAF4029826.1 unnamed protein product [Rotaria magnacalcarata]